MTKKWIMAALVMGLLLSGCGQKAADKPTDDVTGNGTQTTNNEAQQPAKEQPKNEEPATTPPQQETEDGNANKGDTGAVAPATSEKLYHMNKVFNIVPNDPAKSSKNVVLLTFDDGPKDKKTLESLLDTLDKHQAKAIFFVNGYRVKQNPDLLKLIHERGQIIGNHSWDHIDLKKETDASIDQQINDVQKIVKDLTGSAPQFFRPPFGKGNDHVRKVVKENGMLYMTWSNGSLDWDKSTKNKPDKVIANVLDQLHPGSNILMHELPWTTEALDELLTKLKEKGYGFVDPNSIELEAR